MSQSHKEHEVQQDQRVVSRRDAVKGGLAAAAGAFATLLAARRSSAAIGVMDGKRAVFSQNAVTPLDNAGK